MFAAYPTPTQPLSSLARDHFRSVEGRPLFIADWVRTLFIHYEVDAEALQREVPFELDLRDGRAYVSLVAFTMENLRPARAKFLGNFFSTIVAHSFLNVRTYVKHNGEPGIHFLIEWVPNRLSALLGPPTFGLPYRFGRLDYRHHHMNGEVSGRITAGRSDAVLSYEATVSAATQYAPCASGSLSEWLVERYTAFTSDGPARMLFRIWHEPWPQIEVDAQLFDETLLAETCAWFPHARRIGANYSPGVENVWIGSPHFAGEQKGV